MACSFWDKSCIYSLLACLSIDRYDSTNLHWKMQKWCDWDIEVIALGAFFLISDTSNGRSKLITIKATFVWVISQVSKTEAKITIEEVFKNCNNSLVLECIFETPSHGFLFCNIIKWFFVTVNAILFLINVV